VSKSVRQQFADTMLSVGREDSRLVVMVGDISHGILKPFAAECPGRYYNIGILEPSMMSMAAGLSASGLHSVVHTIAPFLIERSFEQIKLDFCYQRFPGNIVTVGSAFDYSNLGCTHHCYGDFAMLKTLPNVQICYPASAVEFDRLFRQAYDNDRLTVYRIAGTPHGRDFAPEDIVLGQGIKVAEGGDATIVATGPQLQTALEARARLRERDIGAEILYVHTIRPLDIALIRESAEKTRNVVVVEEHMRSGGLGDDVLREIYGVPGLAFHSVSIPDHFVTGYGTYAELCVACGLTPENIVDAVLSRRR
jgi:transketolase